MESRVVVVTGAATGIGAAVAAGFAEEGARVVGIDITWHDDTVMLGV